MLLYYVLPSYACKSAIFITADKKSAHEHYGEMPMGVHRNLVLIELIWYHNYMIVEGR